MARLCARLTLPHILPEQGAAPGQLLQQNFQSLGARGVSNLAGELVVGLLPPTLPWIKLAPKPEIAYSADIPPPVLEELYRRLFLRELAVQGTLESAGSTVHGRGRQAGLRTQQNRSMVNLLVCGDMLQRMGPDFLLRVYRLDHYTTNRDYDGMVISHTTNELLDPLILSDNQIDKVGLKKADLEGANAGSPERCIPLITRVEWQPNTKKWKIEQECNDKIIPLGTLNNEKDMASIEEVTPYFSAPYDLVTGENYGHGLVEAMRGDLSALDELSMRELHWAELASRVVPIIDEASSMRSTALSGRSGVPQRGRVVDGKAVEIAFLKTDKLQDFQMVETVIGRLRADVAKTLLIATDSVRNSERTTAYEVQATVVRELDRSTAGKLPTITDNVVLPLINRAIHQLTKNGVRPFTQPLPKDTIDIQILTGLAALVKSAKVQDLMQIAKIAKDLGPEAMAKIDAGQYIDTLMRYMNLYEPQMVRTNEQVAAIRQQMMQAHLQQEAAQQAIASGGKMIENRAAQPPGQAAA